MVITMAHMVIPPQWDFMTIVCCTMNGILSPDHSWMAPHTGHITTPTISQFIWMVVGGEIREVIGRYIE